MTTPTAFDQYGLPADPVDIGQTPGALASAVAAKKATAASRPPAPVADLSTPPVQTQGDPFSIPSGIPKTTGLGQNDFGYNPAIGPAAPASAPAVANIATPTVTFNPTGTQLQNAGVLRPETGPWSSSNLAPSIDGSGAITNSTANIAAPKPSPVLASQPVQPAQPASVSPPTATNPANSTQSSASPANPSALSGARFNPSVSDLSNDGAIATPYATSINGRNLGYGSMMQVPRSASSVSPSASGPGYSAVMSDADIAAMRASPSTTQPSGSESVRVFSDGTGSTPRTMSDANIAELSKSKSLSQADAGIGGGIGSAAYGGTPDIGAFGGGLDATRPAANPSAQAYARARGDNIEAQRYAAADIAAIANRDSRSVLGNAARTAAIDANSSFGTPESRRAAYAATLAGLNAAASDGITPQAQLGENLGAQTGDNYRADIAQQGESARQQAGIAAEIGKPSYQTDAQGRSFMVRGANATPVTGPDGQVTSPLEQKNRFTDAYAKLYEQLGNQTKPDPAHPDDPTKFVQLSPEERMAQFNALTGANVQVPDADPAAAPISASQKPTLAKFMQAAKILPRNKGRSDEQLAAYYQSKYGNSGPPKDAGAF